MGVFKPLDEVIDRIFTEILRISQEVTHPYAPTYTVYRKYRKAGAPMLWKNFQRLYVDGLNVDTWRDFCKKHTGLDIEPRESSNKRHGNKLSNKAYPRKETGNTDRFTNGICHGELNTLPTGGMVVSSVREDKHGNQWCMLR